MPTRRPTVLSLLLLVVATLLASSVAKHSGAGERTDLGERDANLARRAHRISVGAESGARTTVRPPRPPPRDMDCCACTEASAEDIEGSGECLAHCGFVIMRQAFDPAALTKYKVQWTEWFLGRDSTKYKGGRGPVLPRSHYLSYNDDGMLRGSRVHLVPPIHIPVEHLLYSRGFIEVYLAALEVMGLTAAGTTTRTGTATRAGTREKPMLDYATIMHTSYPSCDQTFHQDAPFPEGMRVQLPLMDVPLDRTFRPRSDSDQTRDQRA